MADRTFDLHGFGDLPRVPHIEQYFGVWACQEEAFVAMAEHVSRIDLRAHVISHQTPDAVAKAGESVRAGYTMHEGRIAQIDLSGSLMKYVGSMTAGTSTIAARRDIRLAAESDQVDAILLAIDSPGGTVAGTQELADAVSAAAKKKPVYAQIEDLGASAAFWIASQATKVFANRTALVGSIGTFMAVQDLSGMAAKEGIKVHVIRAGDHKGAGVPGTEVTASQLAEWQRIVNQLNEHFLAGVASGRKISLEQVRTLADGRVHLADSAKSLGLIDAVQSPADTLAQLQKLSSSSRQGARSMSEAVATTVATDLKPLAAQPATLQELEQALPKADEKFFVAQLRNKATLDQAKTAWNGELQTRLEASQKENEQLVAKNKELEAKASPPSKKPGVPALTTTERSEKADGTLAASNARAQFDAAVAEKVKLGLTRSKATALVVREQPELHQAVIDEANEGRKRE